MLRVLVFGTLKQGFPNFATNVGRRIDGDGNAIEAFVYLQPISPRPQDIRLGPLDDYLPAHARL
jgi:hypothetical protein